MRKKGLLLIIIVICLFGKNSIAINGSYRFPGTYDWIYYPNTSFFFDGLGYLGQGYYTPTSRLGVAGYFGQEYYTPTSWVAGIFDQDFFTPTSWLDESLPPSLLKIKKIKNLGKGWKDIDKFIGNVISLHQMDQTNYDFCKDMCNNNRNGCEIYRMECECTEEYALCMTGCVSTHTGVVGGLVGGGYTASDFINVFMY